MQESNSQPKYLQASNTAVGLLRPRLDRYIKILDPPQILIGFFFFLKNSTLPLTLTSCKAFSLGNNVESTSDAIWRTASAPLHASRTRFLLVILPMKERTGKDSLYSEKKI